MGGGGGCETEECGPRIMGAAATQRQLFVAKGGSGTRGAGSSAFSRGCITPGCYWNCPDFGMTLQAKHNTPVGCMEPEGLPVCDPWLTAAPSAQLDRQLSESRDLICNKHQRPTAPSPVPDTYKVLSK